MENCHKYSTGWAHCYKYHIGQRNWGQVALTHWGGSLLAKKVEEISRAYCSRVPLGRDSRCDWKLLESGQQASNLSWLRFCKMDCWRLFCRKRIEREGVKSLEMHRLAGDDWTLQWLHITKVSLVIGSWDKRAGYYYSGVYKMQNLVTGLGKGPCHT